MKIRDVFQAGLASHRELNDKIEQLNAKINEQDAKINKQEVKIIQQEEITNQKAQIVILETMQQVYHRRTSVLEGQVDILLVSKCTPPNCVCFMLNLCPVQKQMSQPDGQ
jgi:hypothetical protein